MTISLDGLPPSVDHSKFYSRIYNATKAQQYAGGQNLFSYNSAPPTSNAHFPTCEKPISDSLMLYNTAETHNSSLGSSLLVVPMGPLAADAFESGMSVFEEVAQGSGTGRQLGFMYNAVARGDLSQNIRPCPGGRHGPIERRNTMVRAFAYVVPLGI